MVVLVSQGQCRWLDSTVASADRKASSFSLRAPLNRDDLPTKSEF